VTSFVDFAPTVAAPFQFQAILDGATYTVIVTWNMFGARYYVNVYAPDGTLIASRALVGTAQAAQVESLSWSSGKASATVTLPHGFPLGRPVPLVVSGCAPAGYNGAVLATPTGDRTLSWAIAADPGQATAFGKISYPVDLVGGYFDVSTMIYRTQSNQFEIDP